MIAGTASLPCAPTLEIADDLCLLPAESPGWSATWIFILVVYAAASLSLKRGSEPLTTFGRPRAVPRAAPGQRRPAPERRHATLAAKHFLDADRHGLHALDDRAIPVDLLRALPAQAASRSKRGRHRFLSARHSHDGGACAAAAPAGAAKSNCALAIWILCCCSPGGFSFMPSRSCRGFMRRRWSPSTITTTTC